MKEKSSKARRRYWKRVKKSKGPLDPNSDDFLNSYQWKQLRMQVLLKFGAKCQCCGATAKTGAQICVDHIKPRVRYPELALEFTNLQVLCGDCNHGKGNWDETDWRPSEGIQFDPLEGLQDMLMSF